MEVCVCDRCGEVETDLVKALIDGWVPYYYLAADPFGGRVRRPLCPKCYDIWEVDQSAVLREADAKPPLVQLLDVWLL
jgi:hypothetical protein